MRAESAMESKANGSCTLTLISGSDHARIVARVLSLEMSTLCRGSVSWGPWVCRERYRNKSCMSLPNRRRECNVTHSLVRAGRERKERAIAQFPAAAEISMCVREGSETLHWMFDVNLKGLSVRKDE